MTNLEKIEEIRKRFEKDNQEGVKCFGSGLGPCDQTHPCRIPWHYNQINPEFEFFLRAFDVMRSIAIAETDGYIDVDKVFEERMKDAKGN